MKLAFLLLVGLAAHASALLTADFSAWLASSKYAAYRTQFERSDLGNYGSFGGRAKANEPITKQPVIFIHGNSDMALHDPARTSKYQTGWNASITYFMSQGYSFSTLYGVTWGPADESQVQQQTHNCQYLNALRNFVDAVLDYTGAPMVDIISHSMGVTLSRKVTHGGSWTDHTGTSCDLGDPLTAKVDTFLGICGANRGLAACDAPIIPTCGTEDGFYPGQCFDIGFICKNVPTLSKFLEALYNANANGPIEGANVYTFWSRADEVIEFGDIVWGYPTSQIRGQHGQHVSDTQEHMQMKDQTASLQYNAVVQHSVS